MQLHNTRNGKCNITVDSTEIKWNYYEQLYATEFTNLGEIDKFLKDTNRYHEINVSNK